MNPKCETIVYENAYFKKERWYTLTDMQRDMRKLESDIHALKSMDIDGSIKLSALLELKDKKIQLLKQMHAKLDEMYS